jgi:hypothetical protein
MSKDRKTARTAGIWFLLTEVTAIVGLLLYEPVLKHRDYVLGAGADAQIGLAALLEMMLVAAIIGTAVVLYPVIRKQSEALALGYVCARLLEGAVIAVGAVSLLAATTLRQEPAGAEPDTLQAIASTLVAVHDWTFVLGPALILGVNSVMLAYLMYRSGLVPRAIAVLGLVGGTLIATFGVLVLVGVLPDGPHPIAFPVFAWEVSFAVWLIVKGFRPAPILDAGPARIERSAPVPAVA